MKRLMAAAVLSAGALLTAPTAAANPDITDPYCTGGQEPLFGICKPLPDQPDLNDAPGLDPAVDLGLDPENDAAI